MTEYEYEAGVDLLFANNLTFSTGGGGNDGEDDHVLTFTRLGVDYTFYDLGELVTYVNGVTFAETGIFNRLNALEARLDELEGD